MTGLADALTLQARTDGDRIALRDSSAAPMSYRDLEARARRVARFLGEQNVEAGDRVALYMPKSSNTIAFIMGVLRAGAVYVPIDPSAPAARVAQILADSSARIALVDAAFAPALARETSVGTSNITLLALSEPHHGEAIDRLPVSDRAIDIERPRIAASSPAYILYTSGSTGRPKGVQVSHGAALTFVQWAVGTFALSAQDCLSSHAPLHFDLSVFDIFAAQHVGASVILFNDVEARSPRTLLAAAERHEITTWYSTPSALMALLQFGQMERYPVKSMKRVLFAGEVFPLPQLKRLMEHWPQARYYNLFGPTETNVCTWYEVQGPLSGSDVATLPIGQPCEHYAVRIMDGEAPCVSGAVGELQVSGPGLMSGYWNRPNADGGWFVRDDRGLNWYRTGDLVSRSTDGNLIFHGRADRRIKRRGYRIELGEIETVLALHPAVIKAVAVAVSDNGTAPSIHVFLTVRAGEEVSNIDLRRFCATRLPLYMIPDRFRVLARLPETSTGKADYVALQALATDA